ncbi:hypothetical protein BDR06DRAFT_976406 [Suillus hirtellus]|nr:hypothetical protein BDR06DRAFT_976406 [Suillus hirtellus]
MYRDFGAQLWSSIQSQHLNIVPVGTSRICHSISIKWRETNVVVKPLNQDFGITQYILEYTRWIFEWIQGSSAVEEDSMPGESSKRVQAMNGNVGSGYNLAKVHAIKRNNLWTHTVKPELVNSMPCQELDECSGRALNINRQKMKVWEVNVTHQNHPLENAQ